MEKNVNTVHNTNTNNNMSATTTTTTATKMLRAFKVVQPTLTIVQQQSSSSSSSSLGNVWKPVGLFPVRRIYCIGRNYRDHVVEMGENPDREEPVFFHKPHNSIVDTMVRNEVWYPPQTSNLHYEGELVVAIGNHNHNVPKGKDLSVDQASNYIYGYALGCDLTRRDLQSVAKKGGKPWCTSKGFDDAAPCGPIVPIPQLLSNNNNNDAATTTTLALAVNNTTRQTSSLNHMIWSVPEIVARLSRYYTLEAGDLIMTGTPAGVGPLERGDTVEISCTDEDNNAVVAPCRFTMV